jgi:hypothetical protein
MSVRHNRWARGLWKAAWQIARVVGTEKPMPDHWLRQDCIWYYLAYHMLSRRDTSDPLDVPVQNRLWAIKLVDEILARRKNGERS